MRHWLKAHESHLGLAALILGGLFLLVALTLSITPAAAAPPSQEGQPTNESCLGCHQQQGMTADIGGHPLSVTIDPQAYSESVHGMESIACVDCHTNITGFPHPEVTASSPRDFALELYPTCQECHLEQYELTLDSVHQDELAAGNINAAVCSDCHDPHTQTRITEESTGELLPEARMSVPLTCAQCHSTIYETYQGSVHGAALQEGDPNVPTCTNCHGVHDIQGPSTNSFRNSIPALCAECHTNETMMAQYGISTNVLDTYVADFHGTTVKLFDETYPDQPTNKAVCTDCHGYHDTIRADDPQAGIRFKDNLLVKCQQCHPDATTETFTDSWLSHYEPSPRAWPLVFFVNLFYAIFIPAVLGGMIVFVLSDVYRRFIIPRRQAKGATDE